MSGWRKPTRKILVIRLGALGDLIHASAAWDAVQQQIPDAEIHLLTSPGYLKLADMMPNVQQLWTWNKAAGWQEAFSLVSRLRKENYEAIVNLHPSFKTWLLTQMIWPKSQMVYHKQKLKVKGAAQRQIDRRHATADFYEPFRRLFKLPSLQGLVPILRVPDGIEPSKTADERWIGLIPGVGAKRSNRAWLENSYKSLLRALLEQPKVRIHLFGGPDEQVLAENLMQALISHPNAQGRLMNQCGKHDILGTARLMARCDVMIGGDTGPMHLAAAVGVPCVGIYAPTSIQRTGPLSQARSAMMVPPESLACWPCELPTCPYTNAQRLACMKQITVDEVLKVCQTLLSSSTAMPSR